VTSNRSAAYFEQLCNLVADWPVLSELCILQPVFYEHLDPGCIPEKFTPDALKGGLARHCSPDDENSKALEHFSNVLSRCHIV
jgi:hypothetical protein